MSTACPKGHSSEWPDWCSVCGERLGAAAADEAAPDPAPAAPLATPPTPSGSTCENCGESRRDDDIFCESCGFDFLSGTSPSPDPAVDGAGADEASTPDSLAAIITVDTEFFEASVGDVDLDLPDPQPEPATVDLVGSRILVGRSSESRGIFPEIDVDELTGDPAVSSRHLMIERIDDSWTLTDLGSTNGTFLAADAEDPIEAGNALPVQPPMSIWLGAWTRIELQAG